MSKPIKSTPYRTRSLRWVPIGIALLTTLVPGPAARADETGDGTEAQRDRYYFFVNLGPYDAEDDVGLLGRSSYAFQLAAGFGHRMNRVFAGEIELGVMGREHELTPDPFPEEDDPTLGIYWLSYSVVARVPARKFSPWVGFGIGSGQAHLDVVDDDYPAHVEWEIDSDSGVLFLYRAGLDVALGDRNGVGFELRRIEFEADLGVFTGGEADIGGTGLLFTYRHNFCMCR